MGFYEMCVQGAPDFELEQNLHIERGYTVETTQLGQALVGLGMAFPSLMPELPDPGDLGSADFDENEQPITPRARDYVQALEHVLVHHGTDELPGIPSHKVSSGDNWHVTAVECVAALDAYALALACGAVHPEAFADDFIPFLRAASRCQGFRVS